MLGRSAAIPFVRPVGDAEIMPSLSPVNACLDAFDQAWEAGPPPDLDEAVRDVGDVDEDTRLELLAGLVMIDLERRWRATQSPRPTVEEYLRRFPELREHARDELVLEEFRVRQRFGDRPEIAEYTSRFGEEFASPLRRILDELRAERQTESHRQIEPAPDSAFMTAAEFIQRVVDSGVMSAAEVNACLEAAPKPVEFGEDLAKLLVRQKRLTRFQAQAIYSGKGGSLVLGNYVVLDRIGAGGMGQVFKALHRRMDRVVALKILPPGKMKDASANERFQREIKAAARLSHPNIVTAHDASQHGKTHFLVMEFVDGIDLSALVHKSGPLSVERAVDFVLQAAAGLQFAHQQGIVHRDIKPANLLIDRKGCLRVLDLGLAHMDNASANLTSTGDVMGTVDYMSPEQAADTKNADARSDVYSLGCTLYYLLQGRPPYGGESVVSRLMAHRDQPIPPLAAGRDDVPGTLEMVYSRMLAKDPHERYPGMQEAAAALRNCGINPPASVETSGRSIDPQLQMFFETWEQEDAPRVARPDLQSTRSPGRMAETTSRKKRHAGGSKPTRPVWKWSALGGLAALVILSVVLIFRRPDGSTLRIEVDDPNLVVLLDGDRLTLTDKTWNGKKKARKHKLAVKVGNQQLAIGSPTVVKLPDGRTVTHKLTLQLNGAALTSDSFEIVRGETTVVRIVYLKSTTAAPVKSATGTTTPPPGGPRADYDAIATGTWIPIKNLGELTKGIEEAQIVDDVLRMGKGAWNWGIPGYQARNGLIRAKVRRVSNPRSFGLAARLTEGKKVSVWINNKRDIGIMSDYGKIPYTERNRVVPTDEWIEFAFAAIDGKLIGYVNGKQLISVNVDRHSIRTGQFGFWVAKRGPGQAVDFKDVEVMVLDSKDITSPRPNGRSPAEIAARRQSYLDTYLPAIVELKKPEPPRAKYAAWFPPKKQLPLTFSTRRMTTRKFRTMACQKLLDPNRIGSGDYCTAHIDKDGRIRQVTAYKNDGTTRVGVLGCATVRYWYDEQGRRIQEVSLDAAGKVAENANRVTVARHAYDGVRMVETRFYDEKASPAENRYGVHRQIHREGNPSLEYRVDGRSRMRWLPSLRLPKRINGTYAWHPVLTRDGKELYFESGSNFQPPVASRIYRCRWSGKRWTDPEPVLAGGKPLLGLRPAISDDGNMLAVVAWKKNPWLPANYRFSHRPWEYPDLPNHGDADIYVSERLPSGEWGPVRNAGRNVNINDQEPGVCFVPGTRDLCFASRTKGSQASLFIAKYSGSGWSPPTKLDISDSPRDPCLINGGNRLYFASSREHAHRILVAEKVNGQWSRGIEIDQSINRNGSKNQVALSHDGSIMYWCRCCPWRIHVTGRADSETAIRHMAEVYAHGEWEVPGAPLKVELKDAVSITDVPSSKPAKKTAGAPRPPTFPYDAATAREYQQSYSKHLGIPVEFTNSVGMRFRLIPPGTILAGHNYSGNWNNARRQVTLTRPFYIAACETRQKEYLSVTGKNSSQHVQPGNLDLPVEMVSNRDAVAFCKALAKRETQGGNQPTYRLPTEAEWEYAARAGVASYYVTGKTITSRDANCALPPVVAAKAEQKTKNVGSYAPNAWGLYDVHGNVEELTSDYWSALTRDPVVDPTGGPPSAVSMMYRGGAFSDTSDYGLRLYWRRRHNARHKSGTLGFRAVLELTPSTIKAVQAEGTKGT